MVSASASGAEGRRFKSGHPERISMGLVYFAIFVALLIALIQNYETMNYKASIKFFHIQTPELPIAILIVISFAVGYIIGYIRAAPATIRSFLKSREIEKLSKKIEEFEMSRRLEDKSDTGKPQISEHREEHKHTHQ